MQFAMPMCAHAPKFPAILQSFEPAHRLLQPLGAQCPTADIPSKALNIRDFFVDLTFPPNLPQK
jgi:hypothetical protein